MLALYGLVWARRKLPAPVVVSAPLPVIVSGPLPSRVFWELKINWPVPPLPVLLMLMVPPLALTVSGWVLVNPAVVQSVLPLKVTGAVSAPRLLFALIASVPALMIVVPV